MNLNKFTKSIKNWPEDDRPREKLVSKGKNTLSNAELLAILIGSGNTKESAVELSRRILSSVDDNLVELSNLSIAELTKNFNGIGQAKAISILAALELGHRRLHAQSMERTKIQSSEDAFLALYDQLADLPYEEIWVLFLSNGNKILKKCCISTGGLSESVADPRKIFKLALEQNATSIILAHNHPSGKTEPGNADIEITKKIKEAGNLLNIRLLDHIIVGENKQYFSFADKGLL